mmetsp:Transcript_19167/g.57578  ORF Transcript_19167/g.57578 Transcript_19167/m.57578 type:complete len:219 (+) Transcript_19167:542-1198(+)
MVFHDAAPSAYQCLSSCTRAAQRAPSGKASQNLPSWRSSSRRSVSARSSASRSRRFFFGGFFVFSLSSSSRGSRPCAARAAAASSLSRASCAAASLAASSASLWARSSSSRALRCLAASSDQTPSVQMPKVTPPFMTCVLLRSWSGGSGFVKLSMDSGIRVPPFAPSSSSLSSFTGGGGVTPSKAFGCSKVSRRPRCMLLRISSEPSEGARTFSTTLQ